FASTFITQELADELLGYDDLIVAIASSRAVVSRLGVSWEAENPYEVRVRASGLTRADLIHGLLALAPEAQLGSLLDELAEEVPAHLLRVLEKGVEVAGAEARNVKPWVSRDAFVRLATHHDREVRERAILLASDLEVPRRLPRR